MIEITSECDLPFGDIAGQVRDGMRNVIVRHAENRNLGNRAFAGANASCALIKRGQVTIEITRIPFAARDFTANVRNLTKRFAIVGHISENDQHVHLFFESQVFSQGQRGARRDETFHGRIICEIEEHRHARECSAFHKRFAKEISHVMLHTHRREHNRKLFRLRRWCASRRAQSCLSNDLRGELIVRHARTGKDGKLLSAQKGIHPVNGRDASLNIIARIHTRGWVDRLSIDISVSISQRLRATINGIAQTVKDAPKHFFRDWDAQCVIQKAEAGSINRETRRTFKDFDHRNLLPHLQHAASAKIALRIANLYHFIVTDVGRALHKDDRTFDTVYAEDFLSALYNDIAHWYSASNRLICSSTSF